MRRQRHNRFLSLSFPLQLLSRLSYTQSAFERTVNIVKLNEHRRVVGVGGVASRQPPTLHTIDRETSHDAVAARSPPPSFNRQTVRRLVGRAAATVRFVHYRKVIRATATALPTDGQATSSSFKRELHSHE